MAAQEGSGFRTAADYEHAVNQLMEQTTISMPRLEESGLMMEEAAAAFCTLDMIHEVWQALPRASTQELFTTVIAEGL